MDARQLADGFQRGWTSAGDRVFFAFSFGPFLGFWLRSKRPRTGLPVFAGRGLSSAARMRAIIENDATILCCTPTYALRLGEIGSAGSTRCAQSSLPASPAAVFQARRARIERLWPGARVFDHHGMTEVGPVKFEMPERPGTLCVIEPASSRRSLIPSRNSRCAEVKMANWSSLRSAAQGRRCCAIARNVPEGFCRRHACVRRRDPRPKR